MPLRQAPILFCPETQGSYRGFAFDAICNDGSQQLCL